MKKKIIFLLSVVLLGGVFVCLNYLNKEKVSIQTKEVTLNYKSQDYEVIDDSETKTIIQRRAEDELDLFLEEDLIKIVMEDLDIVPIYVEYYLTPDHSYVTFDGSIDAIITYEVSEKWFDRKIRKAALSSKIFTDYEVTFDTPKGLIKYSHMDTINELTDKEMEFFVPTILINKENNLQFIYPITNLDSSTNFENLDVFKYDFRKTKNTVACSEENNCEVLNLHFGEATEFFIQKGYHNIVAGKHSYSTQFDNDFLSEFGINLKKELDEERISFSVNENDLRTNFLIKPANIPEFIDYDLEILKSARENDDYVYIIQLKEMNNDIFTEVKYYLDKMDLVIPELNTSDFERSTYCADDKENSRSLSSLDEIYEYFNKQKSCFIESKK